jgi:Domain of unknown function (DUF4037)
MTGGGGGRLSTFVPGRELNRRFYLQAVAPILRTRFRAIRYTAALLGPGSEVLGYDTELSRDHDWGPRAQIFLRPTDCTRLRGRILDALGRGLPFTFEGLATRFSEPSSEGGRVRVQDREETASPLLWIGTIRAYLEEYLLIDPFRNLRDLDWLLIPSHKLLSLAVGPIYHDDLGLAQMRSRFRYYPRDVWLHLLSVQWLRISEEEAFVGRTSTVGDELGSRLIAARQVREMMRLAFLLERRYFPYDKWFGTAFRELPLAERLQSFLEAALDAPTPRVRESALSRAYEVLAKRQNALHLAPALPARVSRFHDRPYQVIHAVEYAAAIRTKIRNRQVRELARMGSIDQFGSTEEVGSRRAQLESLRALLRS